jgi:hypothetical protein
MQSLGENALESFKQIQEEGVARLCYFSRVPLGSCASIVALEEDMHVDEQIVQISYEFDVYVRNNLVEVHVCKMSEH